MKRKCMYFVFVILLFSSTLIKAQNSKELKNIELDSTFITRFTEDIAKEKYIKNSNLKVELIDSCNSSIHCGTMAFASVSKVKILEGIYQNDTILVAELCRKVYYTRKKIYKLNYESSPNFSVILCHGNSYNADYNLKAENDYYLTFGSLKKVINANNSNQ
ncbi:hypothetical protein [uncultured Dokdonia sp.]|uniref:hypothetical protein n=1 Tax=uncultured Dokdonia sp. TaxID=575653 RepID=UPI0026324903|nr:hypothetical protein [uncultured Dokdonia sp.]